MILLFTIVSQVFICVKLSRSGYEEI